MILLLLWSENPKNKLGKWQAFKKHSTSWLHFFDMFQISFALKSETKYF